MHQSGFFSYLYRTFFSFSGRLNRKPFILRSLAVVIGAVALAFVLFYVFGGSLRPGQEYQHRDLLWLHVFLHSMLIILAIIIGFSLGVRRCHDLDKSGWWLLLGLVPYICVFWELYLICKRGTIGPNRYGDDPIHDDFEKIEDIAETLREQHKNLNQ